MKHQLYLTKEGVKIFEELVTHCEEIKLHNADSFELSMLAFNFWVFDQAAKEIAKGGYSQVTQSGYKQITADFTALKQSGEYIKNNAGKFGLNPAAREKLTAFTAEKPKEKKGKLKALTG